MDERKKITIGNREFYDDEDYGQSTEQQNTYYNQSYNPYDPYNQKKKKSTNWLKILMLIFVILIVITIGYVGYKSIISLKEEKKHEVKPVTMYVMSDKVKTGSENFEKHMQNTYVELGKKQIDPSAELVSVRINGGVAEAVYEVNRNVNETALYEMTKKVVQTVFGGDKNTEQLWVTYYVSGVEFGIGMDREDYENVNWTLATTDKLPEVFGEFEK